MRLFAQLLIINESSNFLKTAMLTRYKFLQRLYCTVGEFIKASKINF